VKRQTALDEWQITTSIRCYFVAVLKSAAKHVESLRKEHGVGQNASTFDIRLWVPGLLISPLLPFFPSAPHRRLLDHATTSSAPTKSKTPTIKACLCLYSLPKWIVEHSVPTTFTEEQSRAMERVSKPRKQYEKGKRCEISKADFITYVLGGTYKYFLEEFDDLVTLGIANYPPRNPPYPPPSWNPFEGGSIHHSNVNKPLPPKLILSRPELAGRSREETCLLDLSERDAFIRNVQTWCKKSATHLDGDDAISEKIRKILYDNFSTCPRLQEKMNGAQACIEWDRE